jgi:hypothetical protein
MAELTISSFIRIGVAFQAQSSININTILGFEGSWPKQLMIGIINNINDSIKDVINALFSGRFVV